MLLLHTCCTPCSAAIFEWLSDRNIRFSLFFFNPNIYPYREYKIRKEELVRYANRLGIECIDGDYNHDLWLQRISGLENQAERGTRCLLCFKWRLLATAQLANKNGFKQIATTLASSRWKSLEQITVAGDWAVSSYSDLTFLNKNWRRGGLNERRTTLLKENGFYNQHYCGCEFSLRNAHII